MESIWSQTCRFRQREALPGDMKTDVAVIGAGMAGILIASALQEAGRQVIVLEAERIVKDNCKLDFLGRVNGTVITPEALLGKLEEV